MRSSMSKREQKKFDSLLADIARLQGTTVENLKEASGLNSSYSNEEAMYEAQAAFNFFTYRIAPVMEKGEVPAAFDQRYHAWRFKTCEECKERFAYVFHYDGVKFCSLDCLTKALAKIGIKFSKHQDIKKRWGLTSHPAIVSATALQAFAELYGHDASVAFEPSD